MTNRTPAGLLVVVLAVALIGCDGGYPSGPSAPSSPQPQQTPRPTGSGRDTYQLADVILSGVVYEVTPVGRVPIEGVLAHPDWFHLFPAPPAPSVITDSQGFFSFRPVWVCPCSWAPWVDAGITSIWVDKDGYEVPAGQHASIFGRRLDPGVLPDLRLRDVPINGDTRYEIELVRR